MYSCKLFKHIFPQTTEFEQDEEPKSKAKESIIPSKVSKSNKNNSDTYKIPESLDKILDNDSKKPESPKKEQGSTHTPKTVIKKQEQIKDTDDETDSDITYSEEVK